jgi:hypothetical protein
MSLLPGSALIVLTNTSETSPRSLWTAGATMRLGGSSSNCWMRSPRSVISVLHLTTSVAATSFAAVPFQCAFYCAALD